MRKTLKIYYDNIGNSLVVWFDDPRKEHFASETEEEIVLMKDRKGRVIGFEKLNFILPQPQKFVSLPLEIIAPVVR